MLKSTNDGRVPQAGVVDRVRLDGGEVLACHVHLEPVGVAADHRAAQARHRRRRAEVPVERGRDDRRDVRVDLSLVDGGARLEHPELVDHAGVLHALVLVPVARRVVESGPGEQPAVPVVGRGRVVHLRVRHRLSLLGHLDVGAPVVDGRPGQGADRLGHQVGQARPVHRRLQLRLPVPGRVDDRGVVVLGEDILLVVERQALPGHRARRRPRVVQGVGQLVRGGVERGVVARLVEPRAPDDDRGMVAIADDHVRDVAAGHRLPGRVADVAPAREPPPRPSARARRRRRRKAA